jgi:hypothetical protein
MSLDFSNRLDIDTFKKKCREQREIARKYPAYDRRMATCEDYSWKLGPWSLTFCLEVWREPLVWHGSAAIIEQIGYQSVEWGKTRAEIPQDALLSTSSWVEDHREQARFILGEIMGDILRPGDDRQRALEILGLWAMHHIVEFQGEKTWLKNQN